VGTMYGNPNVSKGGNAMKYAPSVRIEVRKGDDIEEDGVKIGHIINCLTKKNKTAAPHQVTQVRLDYDGKGFNKAFDLVNLGIKFKIINQAGAWFNMFDKQYQGRNSLIQAVQENELLFEKLKNEIVEKNQGIQQ
jgi:recombination protein RecA